VGADEVLRAAGLEGAGVLKVLQDQVDHELRAASGHSGLGGSDGQRPDTSLDAGGSGLDVLQGQLGHGVLLVVGRLDCSIQRRASMPMRPLS